MKPLVCFYSLNFSHQTFQGIAPTLIVTRIAMTLDKTEVSSTPHLSVLQFRGRSTQQTTHNQMNNMSIPVDDEGRRGTEKGEPETKTDAV